MNFSLAESVRSSFREFLRHETGGEPPELLQETTLIREGSYCGRRFSACGYCVVWFIDEQQIKLFGPEGTLLRSQAVQAFCQMAPASPATIPMRRAA